MSRVSVRTLAVGESSRPTSRPDARPTLNKFAHTFWGPELSFQRGLYFKIIGTILTLIIVIMWICLPVYWGSLAHQRHFSKNLDVMFLNRDGSDLGSFVQQAVEASIHNHTNAKLGWRIHDPSTYTTDAAVAEAVLDQKVWMAVVVEASATQNLISARASGDSSYDPTKAITVYYEQGRNELAAANYLVPYSQALLIQAINQFSLQSTTQFLSSQGGNTSAIAAALKAPQTLTQPVYFTMNNLRPYTAPVASALLLVGSIYVIIFAFVLTMSGFMARAALEPYLTTAELVRLRLFSPLLLYLPVSLSYSMISLCFQVPFGAKFTHAGGFFLYWILVYCTMCGVGLALETAVQVVTPKFMPFFLLPLIISNVSIGTVPIDIEPWFYKYGYGFPVYNLGQATRTIIFNVKSRLGLNAGIILAWAAVSVITLIAVTLFDRRKHRRAAGAGVGETNGKEPDLEIDSTSKEEEKPTVEDNMSDSGDEKIGEKVPAAGPSSF